MGNSINSVEELYFFALTFFGIDYEWGGCGPTKSGGYGYDCSGLLQAILSKVGADLPGDQTAHDLYLFHKANSPQSISRGALAFFGQTNATHVGWMIDEYCMISAAGGDHQVKTKLEARLRNANVKIQPISWYRSPRLLGVFMPKYSFSS